MLRQLAPVSSTARPLDLTVVGDSGASSFYRMQQSAPLSLTRTALLQSHADTLCRNTRPPLSAAELRLRSPYSFGPARSLEEVQAYHVSVKDGYGYREWLEEKRPCTRVVEQPRRHPGVVNFCRRSAAADCGQSIIFVINIDWSRTDSFNAKIQYNERLLQFLTRRNYVRIVYGIRYAGYQNVLERELRPYCTLC